MGAGLEAEGPGRGPGAGARERAPPWVAVEADVMGPACAGRTSEEVILITRMSSEGHGVDI